MEGRVSRINGLNTRDGLKGTLARTIQEFGLRRVRVALSQHTGASTAFHSAIDQALETNALNTADIREIFDTDRLII